MGNNQIFLPLEAVSFQKIMSTGKTKPMLMQCIAKTDSEEEVSVVVKLSAGCDLGCKALINEAIAAFFASDLGLPVPCPHTVELSQEFVETIQDREARALAVKSCPVAFGCRYIPGYSEVPKTIELTTAQIETAADIYAFDHMLGNIDRGGMRTNCLTDGSRFAIIDHEMAFSHTLPVILGNPPMPWEAGSADRMLTPEKHIFYKALRGKDICFKRLEAALTDISIARIEEYVDALPIQWENKDYAKELTSYLSEIKAQASTTLEIVRRVFA